MLTDVCVFSVCLKDSVLAFHKHGMQGRSFKANEVMAVSVISVHIYLLSSRVCTFVCLASKLQLCFIPHIALTYSSTQKLIECLNEFYVAQCFVSSVYSSTH